MNSFEMNKMLGAFLATCLVVIGLLHVTDLVFPETDAETLPYKMDVAEADMGAETPVAVEVKGPSFATLLAEASTERGEKVFGKCKACHTIDAGGPNRIGPNLYNWFGRQSGSHEGFAYSGALINGNVRWDYDSLNAYLENPKGYLPGNKMSFGGLKKVKDRANLIAYLRTFNDTPPALPTEAEEASPTGGENSGQN